MRSSRRRSTPACGEGIQGSASVVITTRWVKSALTRSLDMDASSKALGERAQIHLMGPCRWMLRRESETGLRDCLRRHAGRGRSSKTPLSLHLVDQSVEHEMGDMHANGTELARQRLRQPAQRKFGRGKRRKFGAAADAGGGASEDDHALAARRHMGNDGLRGKHCAKASDAPDLLEFDRRRLLERFYEEPMRVVNEHIDAFGMRLECDDNVTGARQIAGEMIIDATVLFD